MSDRIERYKVISVYLIRFFLWFGNIYFINTSAFKIYKIILFFTLSTFLFLVPNVEIVGSSSIFISTTKFRFDIN